MKLKAEFNNECRTIHIKEAILHLSKKYVPFNTKTEGRERQDFAMISIFFLHFIHNSKEDDP